MQENNERVVRCHVNAFFVIVARHQRLAAVNETSGSSPFLSHEMIAQ
jgi:hypothetical protein